MIVRDLTSSIVVVDRFFHDGVVDAQGTVGSAQARGLPSGHQRDFVHGASPDPVTTRTERGVADYFDTHGRLIERKTRQDVSLPAFNNLGPNRGQRHYSHRWKHDTRFGRVLAESWPNGVGRSFVYSSIGAVEAELGLGDAMPLTLREVREVNALGQATVEWLGSAGQHGALLIQRSQTQATGEMESIQYARRATGGANPATIWHETYRYDGWGNLIRRGQSQPDLPTASGSFSQFERYQYDALHRLTESVLTTNGASAPAVSLAYDAVGNLRKKSDFSQNIDTAYSYPAATAARPNAVQSVALASGASVQHYGHDSSGNVVCQFVSGTIIGPSCSYQHSFQAYYNHNQQPVYQERQLSAGHSTAWFTYGADQQPARQWGEERTPDCGGTTPQTNKPCRPHHRIYLDRYEDTVGGFVHFDGSERLYRTRAYVGDYLIATRGRYGELELSFLLRDRLGSVVGVEGVTLQSSNLVELRAETRHSFDAYGTPRSNFKRAGSLWSEQPRWSSPTRTQQGFTGHERLSGLQLIHMRGRVFDPQLGRFHGVDPIIQFPLSSQGLNPYSYILNNPLAGVDPTGYCVAQTGTHIKSCVNVTQHMSDGSKRTQSFNVKSAGDMARAGATAIRGLSNNGASAGAQPRRSGEASEIGSVAEVGKVEAGEFSNGAVTAAMSFAFGQMGESTGRRAQESVVGGAGSLSQMSDAELDAYARAADISGADLREALGVGKWALDRYQPVSNAEGVEYGGLVYRDRAGRIRATAAIKGTSEGVNPFDASRLVPRGATILLDYHTHPPATPGYTNSFFSSQDVRGINSYGEAHAGYVGGLLGTSSGGYFYRAGALQTSSYSVEAISNIQVHLGRIRQ